MSDLLVGVLSALLATNAPMALSNWVVSKTGLSVPIPDPNDPVEQEFRKLMADDDDAHAEMDGWIKQNAEFREQGAGVTEAVLQSRLRRRLEAVQQTYQAFLRLHPQHAGALLAYGSFLNDNHQEAEAQKYWEKARELDPSNPAAWNNLANWYGHNGPVTNAFEYYAKAIELDPAEPVYYQNFATTVYLFRRDATNHFKIDETQVFAKAMQLYRRALELDPENFLLASDYAQSYYGFKPRQTGEAETDRQAEQQHADQAIAAWETAFKLARDDIERQGVQVHFARININAARFGEARRNLAGVTNALFSATKQNLAKKLEKLEADAKAGADAAPTKP